MIIFYKLIGFNFGIVPASYKTEYSYASYGPPHESKNPLEFLKDTGDKATYIIKNAGDQTLWFLKNKINTKVKAIRNILPKLPTGYKVPSSSYGAPVVSYEGSEPNPSYHRESPSTSYDDPNYGSFLQTATLKSTFDSDTVNNTLRSDNMITICLS